MDLTNSAAIPVPDPCGVVLFPGVVLVEGVVLVPDVVVLVTDPDVGLAFVVTLGVGGDNDLSTVNKKSLLLKIQIYY